jgi:hypothetical protein
LLYHASPWLLNARVCMTHRGNNPHSGTGSGGGSGRSRYRHTQQVRVLFDPGIRTWQSCIQRQNMHHMLVITNCGAQAPSAQLIELKHGENRPCKAQRSFHQQQRMVSPTLAKAEAAVSCTCRLRFLGESTRTGHQHQALPEQCCCRVQERRCVQCCSPRQQCTVMPWQHFFVACSVTYSFSWPCKP